jgi:hypothetical protein
MTMSLCEQSAVPLDRQPAGAGCTSTTLDLPGTRLVPLAGP